MREIYIVGTRMTVKRFHKSYLNVSTEANDKKFKKP